MSDIWEYDTLKVNDDGQVEGSAYTREFGDGHTVQIGVYSYRYTDRGELKDNHVPIVTVVDDTGRIVGEPYAHDSSNPNKAISFAQSTAELVYDNPEEFI